MKLRPHATAKEAAEFNQKQLFVRDAMPGEWLGYAQELGAAAEALWENSANTMEVCFESEVDGPGKIEKNVGHCRSYILLAGLALENALKAAIISEDPTLINTGALAGCLKSHKLLELASRSRLRFTKTEKKLMQMCQDAIPYWGRYPIPLSYAGLKPKEAANPKFRGQFRRLHFRLCKLVYHRIKDGWDSGVGPRCIMLHDCDFGDESDVKTQRKRYAYIEGKTAPPDSGTGARSNDKRRKFAQRTSKPGTPRPGRGKRATARTED